MAACYGSLSIPAYNEILSVCKGLKISHVWRGVGACLVLEVGRLSKSVTGGQPDGQLCFMFECDWRVERPRSIHFGSGDSTRLIESRIASLLGVRLIDAVLDERLRELMLRFDDGRTFRTFTCWSGQPRWNVGFRDGALYPLSAPWQGVDVTPWIYVRSGRVVVEYCYDDRLAKTRTAVEKLL